jgi:hypothetical protein
MVRMYYGRRVLWLPKPPWAPDPVYIVLMNKNTSMRPITLHDTSACTLTPYAAQVCQVLNAYKKAYPQATFKQMARWYNRNGYRRISETSVARYYYGYHYQNSYFKGKYARVRQGASVTLM